MKKFTALKWRRNLCQNKYTDDYTHEINSMHVIPCFSSIATIYNFKSSKR